MASRFGTKEGMATEADFTKAMVSRGLTQPQANEVLKHTKSYIGGKTFEHSQDPAVRTATEAVMRAWPKKGYGRKGEELEATKVTELTKSQVRSIAEGVIVPKTPAFGAREEKAEARVEDRRFPVTVTLTPRAGGIAKKFEVGMDALPKSMDRFGMDEFLSKRENQDKVSVKTPRNDRVSPEELRKAIRDTGYDVEISRKVKPGLVPKLTSA